jgi:hypothetical protein
MVLRSDKGAPLTHAELDTNFTELNNKPVGGRQSAVATVRTSNVNFYFDEFEMFTFQADEAVEKTIVYDLNCYDAIGDKWTFNGQLVIPANTFTGTFDTYSSPTGEETTNGRGQGGDIVPAGGFGNMEFCFQIQGAETKLFMRDQNDQYTKLFMTYEIIDTLSGNTTFADYQSGAVY